MKKIVQYQTYRPLPSAPRLLDIGHERVHHPQYHHEGRFRQSEMQTVFQYTLAGAGIFRHRTTEYRTGPGQGFLTTVRDPDTAYYAPPDSDDPWEFVYISFDGEFAERWAQDLIAQHGHMYELPATHPLIRDLLRLSHQETGPRSIDAATSADRAMSALLALLRAAQSLHGEDPAESVSQKALRIIKDHEEDNWNASDVAHAMEISREHLTRVFREETGAPLYQTILRQRMLRACHMLKESQLAVSEIARRLGYDEPGHFTRAFKRSLGLSPSRFRVVGSPPVA